MQSYLKFPETLGSFLGKTEDKGRTNILLYPPQQPCFHPRIIFFNFLFCSIFFFFFYTFFLSLRSHHTMKFLVEYDMSTPACKMLNQKIKKEKRKSSRKMPLVPYYTYLDQKYSYSQIKVEYLFGFPFMTNIKL